MNGIDTIILDLGGVLIDVDYRATAHAFTQLGHQGFDALYSKAKQDHVFDAFETGAITPAEFRDRIRRLLSAPISDEEIDTGWNAMLGVIPEERLRLVERLKQRYRLLLLSNTNAIHVPAFERIIEHTNGIRDFRSLFHGAYYSCEMGMRKPDAEIFIHVISEHDAEAGRTLFIDDSIQHVIGAREAGLHAEHLELAHEDIIALCERLEL